MWTKSWFRPTALSTSWMFCVLKSTKSSGQLENPPHLQNWYKSLSVSANCNYCSVRNCSILVEFVCFVQSLCCLWGCSCGTPMIWAVVTSPLYHGNRMHMHYNALEVYRGYLHVSGRYPDRTGHVLFCRVPVILNFNKSYDNEGLGHDFYSRQ